MKMSDLIDGASTFRKSVFKKNKNKYIDLVKNGQHPKALFIGCSDSRVVPNLITNSDPGDLFVYRNVGNFVPPFNPKVEFHGTAAAIEYAVSHLKVSNIIICGHSHCGAIKGVYERETLDMDSMAHLRKWLELGNRAKDMVDKMATKYNFSFDEKLKHTEQISVIFSMQNILTYPKVAQKVMDGTLSIRGWYYKIETGEILFYDEEEMDFLRIV
ncbi:MAG: carbonic anhydrase [Epsilonproteobacteria bacterium]|nr:carbonic anhydrase [Campylobacterota bacterium]